MGSLLEFTYGLVNFLAVSETKLDSASPTRQFNLQVFRTPLHLYVNSNMPSKVLNVPDCPSNILVIPVEINLKEQNWLVAAIYTPSRCKNYFTTQLSKVKY